MSITTNSHHDFLSDDAAANLEHFAEMDTPAPITEPVVPVECEQNWEDYERDMFSDTKSTDTVETMYGAISLDPDTVEEQAKEIVQWWGQDYTMEEARRLVVAYYVKSVEAAMGDAFGSNRTALSEAEKVVREVAA